MKFLNWIKGSADNSPGGASSKKLSAFWTLVIMTTPPVLVWTYWAYKNNDWSMLVPVLTILFASVATFLSINAVEKIKGKANTEEEKKPE
jgi:membrane protein YdbS with pleckstrin-like domain